MVKRFVNVRLHCIVSNLTRASKMLTLPPHEKNSADAHASYNKIDSLVQVKMSMDCCHNQLEQ